MRERFEEIYATNEWTYGSGEGSLPIHTKDYVAMLQKFLRKHQIKTVVDLGCGDWQFSQLIDWEGIDYQGFDIVRSVVEKDQSTYSTNNIKFHLYSGDPKELPSADLLIAKDVLQHWSYKSIDGFLPLLKKYKYSLITNCVNPKGVTINTDIPDGNYRFLDMRQPPFNLNAKEILTYTNYKARFLSRFCETRWLEKVLLITNEE